MNRVEIAARTYLAGDGGALRVEEVGAPPLPVPGEAVTAVFERYARPLAGPAPDRAPDDETLTLAHPSGSSAHVRAFLFTKFGDVIPTFYLLYEVDGREPLAAPAVDIARPLVALARAARVTPGS